MSREKWEAYVQEAKDTATEGRLEAILWAQRRIQRLEKVREKAEGVAKKHRIKSLAEHTWEQDCNCNFCAALAEAKEEG